MTIAFRYTTKDLEELPYVEGVRYEIIDGELYVTTQPHGLHQYAWFRIANEIDQWITSVGSGAVIPAPGVIFSDDNNVAPDLIWLRRKDWAQLMDSGGHFHNAPDLVIEIASPGTVNQARDRELKLALYSRRAVPEYWIADYRALTVEVYRQQDGELKLVVTLRGTDTLASPLMPGFECPISRFWGPTVD